MAVVTSAFKGITTPISELYAQIHSRGWTVTKVDTKDGAFLASAKNPHGETVEKTGRDVQTALAAVLTYVVRREFIRQGAWTQHWGDQLEPIAQAYAKAPTFDAAAAGAWAELAADNMARAQALQQQLQVEVVDEPDPYPSPQKLWEDVEKHKKIKVTRANADHPLWNEDQVLAHRLVHDVLGHAAAGGDFGWTGENLATAAHMPYLSPSAQAALFSECIGQAAYRNYYRGHGPRKITFLNEFLNPAQEENNAPGHGGEPINNSLTPGPLPEGRQASYDEAWQALNMVTRLRADMSIGQAYADAALQLGISKQELEALIAEARSTVSPLKRRDNARGAAFEPDYGQGNHILNWTPGRPGKGIVRNDGSVETWNTLHEEPYHGEKGIQPGDGRVVIDDHGNAEVYGGAQRHVDALTRADPRLNAQGYGAGFEWHSKRTAGLRRDPNAGYVTGIVPPAVNAVASFGDPLDHMGLKDVQHRLDTGWSKLVTPDGKPDFVRMKQAITNAFRAALLSPKKSLRWNAVHYQDLQHIPHDVTDPKVYWEALENARINHNRNEGVPHPEVAHKAHYEALLDFYRYYQKLHPDMDPNEVKEYADREALVMQQEIERKLLADSKDPDNEIIESKMFKLLDKRLKQIVKDDPTRLLYTSADDGLPVVAADKYGAFMGTHLSAIAKISRYTDLLLEAALEDIKNHDASGHHFRQATLSLNIPYVGPKVASFAWLLLQPLTSQIATIDTHMCDILGYKQKDVDGKRDYFRLERELQAGRDAAGYGHMPLGAFQWAMWDNKRNGEGEHQDHSSLRPLNPQSHHTIDWRPRVDSMRVKGEDYEPPPWWSITEPYRQNEVARWNIDVAPGYRKDQIPWQDEFTEVPDNVSVPVLARNASEGNADEVHISLDVPERIRERIALWMADLELEDVEPLDPAEYHITLAYADHGVESEIVQSATTRFNYTGLKFEGKRLTRFNNALVVELTCDNFDKYATELNDWLEEQGVEVSRYPGGYKPHITIGYTDRDDVTGELPPLSFRAGRMNFSTPRPLRDDGRPLTAPSRQLWNKVAGRQAPEPIMSVKERQELHFVAAMRQLGDKAKVGAPVLELDGKILTGEPGRYHADHWTPQQIGQGRSGRIKPDGQIMWYDSDEYGPEEWKGEYYSARVAPVRTYKITGQADDDPYLPIDGPRRRDLAKPFIYDGTVVHLGDLNSHHGQVAQVAGFPHTWMQDYTRGANIHGLLRGDQVQWYNQPTTDQHRQRILNALGKHIGQDVTEEDESYKYDPNMWHDSAKRCPKCQGALTIKGDCRDCGWTEGQLTATSSDDADTNGTSTDIVSDSDLVWSHDDVWIPRSGVSEPEPEPELVESEPEPEVVPESEPTPEPQPDLLLAELQSKVDSLTAALSTARAPENAPRRKLIIRRDENNRIASIEEETPS